MRRDTFGEDNDTLAEEQDEISCEACDPDDDTQDQPLHFCYACDVVLCESCWKAQLPHRKNKQATSGIVHEKTDPWTAKKVQSALSPPADEKIYARLCMQDENTAWFGKKKLNSHQTDNLHIAQELTAKIAKANRLYSMTQVDMPN